MDSSTCWFCAQTVFMVWITANCTRHTILKVLPPFWNTADFYKSLFWTGGKPNLLNSKSPHAPYWNKETWIHEFFKCQQINLVNFVTESGAEKPGDLSVCCLHAPVEVTPRCLARGHRSGCIAVVGPRLSNTSRPKWVNSVCSHSTDATLLVSFRLRGATPQHVWMKVTSAHLIPLISNLRSVRVCTCACTRSVM